MHTKSALVSFVMLAVGCAGSQGGHLDSANAPKVAARLMTPKGSQPVPAGTFRLGADPRFALRLDSEAPAHVYLVRCADASCQVDPAARQARPGVPLLLDGPGGWLTMGKSTSEEVRVLAAATPLSSGDLSQFTQAMTRREPETSPPEKRGPEEKTATLDGRVAVLTLVLHR